MGDNSLKINAVLELINNLRRAEIIDETYINANFSKLFPNTDLLSTSRKFSRRVA